MRAHRGAQAAHQHRDVIRVDVLAERSRLPGTCEQLFSDLYELLLLGLRLHPDLLAGARERVLDRGVARRRLRIATQQILEHGERLAVGLERLARPRGEQPELLAQELDQQRLFGREVAIDGADTDARLAGDVVDLCVGPVLGEHSSGALENPLAIAPRVGAERAVDINDHSVGHSIFTRLA